MNRGVENTGLHCCVSSTHVHVGPPKAERQLLGGDRFPSIIRASRQMNCRVENVGQLQNRGNRTDVLTQSRFELSLLALASLNHSCSSLQ